MTFITGTSNTGKSHILKCVDFALGAPAPQREFPEARGYDRVHLEFATNGEVVTIRRTFGRDETAEWFAGGIDDWDDEKVESLPVHVDRTRPRDTLGGRLLEACGFDPTTTLVKNQRGDAQILSFRTLSRLFLVSEEEVIGEESPVAPPSFNRTAERSAFSLVISGETPTEEEIRRLREAHGAREHAEKQLQVLEPMIDSLRDEIAQDGFSRTDLEGEISDIDEQLAELSELVAASGDAVRDRLERRNEALTRAQEAHERVTRAQELHTRFELLAEHYATDVERLEFALESGHFFQQLEASHCPRCGRPLDPEEACHPESADFAAIEQAARADLKKLTPRMADLQTTIEEVNRDAAVGAADVERWRGRARTLDAEIQEVANPTAKRARARVKALAEQRQMAETHLLRYRELDRYLAMKQEADLTKQRSVDTYRPVQDAPALRSLQTHVKGVLQAWRFPVRSDVVYDTASDDLLIDGKARKANGKGVRAVTHAAFTVGLMYHCHAESTPHAGFVIVDSPLTPFRGVAGDDEEDPELRADVHAASLRSLAAVEDCGQAVVIENIDPPAGLEAVAGVVVFTGQAGQGRTGFYPVES